MSSTASAGTKEQSKKHSLVFLAVFTVFLATTAISVAAVCVGVLLAQPAHHDTQWFWASGHLLAHGANPYDREALGKMEFNLGLHIKRVLMTLNPPFSFFLFVPLGLLSARYAIVAWSLLLAVFLLLSVQAIRGMIGHPYERGYLLLAWFFPPALWCVEVGQTGLITLLGLALFLRFHERRPLWAGMALSLCAVKPHLFLPFGMVLLLWIIAKKKWSIFAGAVLALGVESLIAMAFDHDIWTQYRYMMRTERFADQFIPTLGDALRFLINQNAMWLGFIPAILGCMWALWYFFRNRERWNWKTHGSLLTLVSLVAAPYAWFTDQVIAIPAILFTFFAVARPRRGSLTLLLTIMIAKEVQVLITKPFFAKTDIVLGILWVVWYLYATGGSRAAEEAVAAG